jgi:hypothetical protein
VDRSGIRCSIMLAEDIHISAVGYLCIGSIFIVLEGDISQEGLGIEGLLSTDDIKA